MDNTVLAKWAVNVGSRNARTRLAHLLCEMACRYKAERTGGGVTYRLPITQAELGSVAALTPVHVNRTLMSLRSDGMGIREGVVKIDDWDIAVKIADFDDTYLQLQLAPQERLRISPLQ